MSFQDELKANYRTKDEANDELREEIESGIYDEAKETLQFIKKCLLDEARAGNTSIENGIRIVKTHWQIPSDFLHVREEKTEAVYGQSFWGKRTLIKPSSKKMVFSLNRCRRYDLFIEYLTQMATLEDIEIIKPVLRNRNTNKIYDLPYTLEGYYYFLDWGISVICKTEIKDRNPNMDSLPVEYIQSDDAPNIINIDNMEGHIFEQFCAKLLLQNGFDSVDVTRGSGDQGVDIIAVKDGVKYGIQCKCYSADIGNSAVQEVFSGKSYYKCHVGVVLTNRFFTRSAVTLAESNDVLLWDRTKLLTFIKNAGIKIE